ncbi:MAG: SET domain-containing protein-lysine N-methyltransferase [Planctomycetota bacterium]
MSPQEQVPDADQAIHSATSPLAVVRVDAHYRVLAAHAHLAGSLLLRLDGNVVAEPSRFSVQVGINRHIATPEGDLETALDQQMWRFLNHSCAPNAVFRGLDLLAIHDIAPWEQVTFDYNTTELELATPFRCQCGAARCVEWIRGYTHLSVTQKRHRAAYAASYLIGASTDADIETD